RAEADHARRAAVHDQPDTAQPWQGHARHAWTLGLSHPTGDSSWLFDPAEQWSPTATCAMTVLTADLRCRCWPSRRDPRAEEPCQCVGHLLHRGACLACTWEGPPRCDENEAAEDAADHAH